MTDLDSKAVNKRLEELYLRGSGGSSRRGGDGERDGL
jgi:hypothetical protein